MARSSRQTLLLNQNGSKKLKFHNFDPKVKDGKKVAEPKRLKFHNVYFDKVTESKEAGGTKKPGEEEGKVVVMREYDQEGKVVLEYRSQGRKVSKLQARKRPTSGRKTEPGGEVRKAGNQGAEVTQCASTSEPKWTIKKTVLDLRSEPHWSMTPMEVEEASQPRWTSPPEDPPANPLDLSTRHRDAPPKMETTTRPRANPPETEPSSQPRANPPEMEPRTSPASTPPPGPSSRLSSPPPLEPLPQRPAREAPRPFAEAFVWRLLCQLRKEEAERRQEEERRDRQEPGQTREAGQGTGATK